VKSVNEDLAKLLGEVYEMNKCVNWLSRTKGICECIRKFFPENIKHFPLLEEFRCFNGFYGTITHLTSECDGTRTTATSSISRQGRSRKRLEELIHTQGHVATIRNGLKRMQLIWELTHGSFQLFAEATKIFRTPGITGCAMTLRRAGLRRLATYSAHIAIFPAVHL
jgi:hypothetical protein